MYNEKFSFTHEKDSEPFSCTELYARAKKILVEPLNIWPVKLDIALRVGRSCNKSVSWR